MGKIKINQKISVILPVYNEEDVIEDVIENIIICLKNRENLEYEIVVVDDASTDNSYKILKKIEGIKLIKHEINRGYGASLKTGIKNAKYDTICIMDSDGQHNPEDIFRLLEKYDSPDKMVVGERKITDTFKSRIIGKLLIKFISSYLFNFNIKDLNSGLRVFSKKIVTRYLHLCSDRFSFTTSLTLIYLANSLEIIYVPINVRIRERGKSTVNLISGILTIYKIVQISLLYKPIKSFLPFFIISLLLSLILLTNDIIVGNITDSTVLLLSISAIMFFFILVAEQINVIKTEILKRIEELNEKR